MNEEQNSPADTTSTQKKDWHKPLTTVTPLSKYLAMALFVALPFVGFWLGVEYGLVQGSAVSNTDSSRTVMLDNVSTKKTNVSYVHFQVFVRPLPEFRLDAQYEIGDSIELRWNYDEEVLEWGNDLGVCIEGYDTKGEQVQARDQRGSCAYESFHTKATTTLAERKHVVIIDVDFANYFVSKPDTYRLSIILLDQTNIGGGWEGLISGVRSTPFRIMGIGLVSDTGSDESILHELDGPPQTDAIGWTTYKNLEYGFELTYPTQFTKTERVAFDYAPLISFSDTDISILVLPRGEFDRGFQGDIIESQTRLDGKVAFVRSFTDVDTGEYTGLKIITFSTNDTPAFWNEYNRIEINTKNKPELADQILSLFKFVYSTAI